MKHAQAFADALPDWVERFVDIGSGGGLPGLPIALARPDLSGTLLDASQKRTAFLVWAVGELGLADRLTVRTGRAEVIGREPGMREAADAVVSRGFGPPAMTVECAASLVRDGGVVVISEPPQRRAWPVEPLGELGLAELVDQSADEQSADEQSADVHSADVHSAEDGSPRQMAEARVVVFRREGVLADRFPRSAKQLKRAPLFEL